jgi:uncharacterized protein YdaU (DUF1376 family)
MRDVVMAFWVLEDNVWIQPRLQHEWNYVREKRGKARESANKRWNRTSD